MKDYYKSKESVEEYIKLAQDVDGRALIAHLKEHLPVGSTVLEIGSGPGSDWRLLAKDYQVTGSDFSNEFISYLKENNPQGRFLELDAITLETKEKFDGIYSNKVLQHLQDDELEKSILAQYALLKEDGIICHSFWCGEGSEIFNGLFVNYHTEMDLDNLFNKHFQILLITPYAEFEAGDSLLLIAKKLEKTR